MINYTVLLIDAKTGATSEIDNINARENYTAEDYINDCISNADSTFCDMILNNTIKLVCND